MLNRKIGKCGLEKNIIFKSGEKCEKCANMNTYNVKMWGQNVRVKLLEQGLNEKD